MKLELYDFRKPGRLATVFEQRLNSWLRDACALAPEKWGEHLPYRVEVTLRGLEIVRPADALLRVSDTAVGYRVSLAEGAVLTMLTLPRQLVLALVSALLGEAGTALPADRALTMVEDSLCEYVIQTLLLGVIQETWPGSQSMGIKLSIKEPHPKWTRVFPLAGNVVVSRFVVNGPFGEQEWSWMLPHQGLLELFAHSESDQEAAQEELIRPRLESLVREIPVEIAVTLGAAELPLSLLSRLRVGDLVILDQRVSEPLVARVAGEKKFKGWPGRTGSRQAFQIDSPLEC